MQKMKAIVDTQSSDFKNSKRRPEAVDGVGGSLKKKPKVVADTTSTPQCSTVRKEETRIEDSRAAMFKSRFADTISKAQQTLNRSKTVNPLKTKQQRKKIIETAEPKTRVELKQRERDREAARIAVESMKNTAGIEINLDAEREFNFLVGSSSSLIHRKRDRESARISLESMKNTAGIEINLEAEREFNILIGSSSFLMHRIGG
ncbi:hypothetical protein F3Y22_tig00000778pilonHSYRG00174 [Hibiscus syriacus]|uniref:Uncharacterized protein n=1 Tax=Hibiscus syriacus TaxID=106335 RepID=A0A6A3CYE0_HIBSY|nr:hypothetical protein F3Y22_tig00000778pilonHSYRG00174 [Hibiscus syriacus]